MLFYFDSCVSLWNWKNPLFSDSLVVSFRLISYYFASSSLSSCEYFSKFSSTIPNVNFLKINAEIKPACLKNKFNAISYSHRCYKPKNFALTHKKYCNTVVSSWNESFVKNLRGWMKYRMFADIPFIKYCLDMGKWNSAYFLKSASQYNENQDTRFQLEWGGYVWKDVIQVYLLKRNSVL